MMGTSSNTHSIPTRSLCTSRTPIEARWNHIRRVDVISSHICILLLVNPCTTAHMNLDHTYSWWVPDGTDDIHLMIQTREYRQRILVWPNRSHRLQDLLHETRRNQKDEQKRCELDERESVEVLYSALCFAISTIIPWMFVWILSSQFDSGTYCLQLINRAMREWLICSGWNPIANNDFTITNTPQALLQFDLIP